jgi:hypothetical protein
MLKTKVVIVENQTDTDMTIVGTRYFDSDSEARAFVADHNAHNHSRAYVVHVSQSYTVMGQN